MPDSPGGNTNEIVSRCPRCARDVPWAELARHLWHDHRLVLDGQRVREPWALIKEWVKSYAGNGPPWLLVRSRQLAQTLDPERGAQRLQRLLLTHGVEDLEARAALLGEASANLASICPKCYNLVPCPQTVSFTPAVVARGRVSAQGYSVQIKETGFVSSLVIETPDKVLFDGPEPTQRLTFAGRSLTTAGPFILAALVCVFVLRWAHMSSVLPVSLLLLGALIAFVIIQYRFGKVPGATERAVDYAWRELVPQLHANGFSRRDGDFVAALALATAPGVGNRKRRKRLVRDVLKKTGSYLGENADLAPYLAPLWRLYVEDHARAGRDPVPYIVREVALCFEGKLRLTFAEQLFAGWDKLFSRGDWADRVEHTANTVRCRVLVLDRAFEAGLEVRDLYLGGIIAPALGDMLGTDDLNAVMAYRYLWSLRASRPWERFGEGQSVFELAADPDAANEVLGIRADLLVNCTNVPELYLGTRGVVFRGTVFTQPPKTIEVRAGTDLMDERDVSYLVLSGHRFRFTRSPEAYVARLERWFRYYFQDFRPGVQTVQGWRTPKIAPMFNDPGVFRCPTCRRLIVPQPGIMAIDADELNTEQRLPTAAGIKGRS